MPKKTTASFFDIIQFNLFLPFLVWKQRKSTLRSWLFKVQCYRYNNTK